MYIFEGLVDSDSARSRRQGAESLAGGCGWNFHYFRSSQSKVRRELQKSKISDAGIFRRLNSEIKTI
jgi:hypothetical protein